MFRVLAALPLAAFAVLAGGAAHVHAQGAGRPPPSDELRIMPVVKGVEVVRGHAVVAAQIEDRSGALLACAQRGRTTFVRANVRLRWNARGQVRAVTVAGGGGAFNRCAGRALRGVMADPPTRAGTGVAAVIVRTGAPTTPTTPPPTTTTRPDGTADLQRCTADSDCTIYFQTSACIPQDPVAVSATADPAAVRTAFPPRRIECGMGGPQYDELRESNEGRYSAACERLTCVVRDAGLRPTMRQKLQGL